ncbi:unnamed protein product [Rhizophagus irregularis]|nr:unnamed protein product [Rhizophagus irregularis]CAB5383420.1 unnamed protein product [Rhizophagus irregularis]
MERVSYPSSNKNGTSSGEAYEVENRTAEYSKDVSKECISSSGHGSNIGPNEISYIPSGCISDTKVSQSWFSGIILLIACIVLTGILSISYITALACNSTEVNQAASGWM